MTGNIGSPKRWKQKPWVLLFFQSILLDYYDSNYYYKIYKNMNAKL